MARKKKAVRKTEKSPEPEVDALPDVLTVEQAARYLQVSKSTLYKWIESRKVPYRRLGGNERGPIRFSRRQLLLWIEGGAAEAE